MNYLKIDNCDTVNGEGVGVAIWLAGCSHACEGCFNPESWNYKAGQPFTNQTISDVREALSHSYISRLTVTGGDPLADKNWKDVRLFLQHVKKELAHISIWVYTGYKLEELLDTDKALVLECVDVLIDGKYESSLPKALWRGSDNQRVIKLKEGA